MENNNKVNNILKIILIIVISIFGIAFTTIGSIFIHENYFDKYDTVKFDWYDGKVELNVSWEHNVIDYKITHNHMGYNDIEDYGLSFPIDQIYVDEFNEWEGQISYNTNKISLPNYIDLDSDGYYWHTTSGGEDFLESKINNYTDIKINWDQKFIEYNNIYFY